MAEEIIKFRGYCVYINDISEYAQIVGIMNNEDNLNETIFVSLNKGEEQAVVYINESFYSIFYDKEHFCIKLGDLLNNEESYTTYYNKEINEVTYNKQKLDYLSITKNIEIYEIPDELKYKLFTYEITKDGLISFLSYSNPLDLSIFSNKIPDSNIFSILPDNKEYISKINSINITLIRNIDYQVNSGIEQSVIVDSNGNVLSQFKDYTDHNGKITINFDTTVTQDCSIFIPDNTVSIKVSNQPKGETTSEEDFPIPYFLTDYTYKAESQEPEIPEEEKIVINGIIYYKTQPSQPQGNYELQTVIVDGVTYYTWVASEEQIEYYVTPTPNSISSTTFNGLFKYYNEESVVNSGRRRIADTIFINKSLINRIDVIPQIRTKVHFSGEDSDRNIIFEKDSIKVIISEEIIDQNGVHTQMCDNITYNKAYTINLETIRYLKLKIEFYIDDTYHLEKTVQFYNIPNNLYSKLINSNTFNQSDYNSLIDVLTGEPAVVKYGCLLLTGHDVIESIETDELDENNQPITKFVAELIPTTKVRMGNLKGIYNETFGTNQPNGYGLYGESVYLTGNFYLNNGKSLVDINNDVTMAVGNINRIQNALENLNSNFQNSIYNLTLSQSIMASTLTASFGSIISNNNDALFKLGKDYSIWSLGNAGIAIINPNATYTEAGDIDDSTIGDNDEYILLQGESVQISTSVIKNNRLKVIICNIDPQGFIYPQSSGNEQLYYPVNLGIKFAVGWITTEQDNPYITGEKHIIYPENSSVAKDYYRYVALEKTVNINNSNELSQILNPTRDNCNIYSFTVSRIINGANIYTTFNGNETFDSSNSYYVIPDTLVAGLFEDGKFNANLINVQDLVAVESQYKDYNFDVTSPIKWHSTHNDHNYPTTNIDKPFAVISGTTGKITAQGIDLKEATVGNVENNHIHITDNQGTQTTNSRNEPGDLGEPGIYIKNQEILKTKISGKIEDLQGIYGKSDQSLTTNRIGNLAISNCFSERQIRIYDRRTHAYKDFNDSSNLKIIDQTVSDNKSPSPTTISGYDNPINSPGLYKYNTQIKYTYNDINYILYKYVTLNIQINDNLSGISIEIVDSVHGGKSSPVLFDDNGSYNNSNFNVFSSALAIKGAENYAIVISGSYTPNNNIHESFLASYNEVDETMYISKIFTPNCNQISISIRQPRESVWPSSPGVYSTHSSYSLNMPDNIYFNYDVDKIEYPFNEQVRMTSLTTNFITIPKQSSATFNISGISLVNPNATIKSKKKGDTNWTNNTLFETPISGCINIGVGLAECNQSGKPTTLVHDLSSRIYAIHGIVSETNDDGYFELNKIPIECHDSGRQLQSKDKIYYSEKLVHRKIRQQLENDLNNLTLENQSIYYNNSNTDKELKLVFFIKVNILQNILKILDYLSDYRTNSKLPNGWSPNISEMADIYARPSWNTVENARIDTDMNDVYSHCFHGSNVWEVNDFPTVIEFEANSELSAGTVTIHYNNFNTNILGNGFGSGFNKNNLISVNVLDQYTECPSINANFISNGNGIILNNGMYESLNGIQSRHYFPILNGKFNIDNTNQANIKYKYDGYSLITNNSNNLIEYENKLLRGISIPSFANEIDFIKIVGMFITAWIGENIDFTRLYSLCYSEQYDIYYGQVTYAFPQYIGDQLSEMIINEPGQLMIIFGKQWESIFDQFPNINENYFKVNIFADTAEISPIFKFINISNKVTSRTIVGDNIVTNNLLLPKQLIIDQDNSYLTTTVPTATNSYPTYYPPNYTGDEEYIYAKYGLCIKLRDIFKEHAFRQSFSPNNDNYPTIWQNSPMTSQQSFNISVEFGPE